MSMRALIRSVQRRLDPYAPLIEVEISRSAVIHNLHAYQKAHKGMAFAPVLKSNAYGHGLTLIARLLDREDIPFFMVDSLYEAKQLRHAGVKSRIVVMGYVRPRDIVRARLKDVDFALIDATQASEVLERATRPVRVHLKLDTGMHRQGIEEGSLTSLLASLKAQENVSVVGVCSHFGDADSEDETNTKGQLEAWKRLSRQVLDAFPTIEYRHLSATKGVRFAKESGTNVVRLGIGLYGIDTSPYNDLPLRPALSMQTIVSSVRTVPRGDWVGYNATYRAESERTIATIPAGYFEGIDRRLSGKGALMVDSTPCPIAGRVSMNICSIDVTDVKHVVPGTKVTVVSRDPAAPNSIERMADTAGTTPYVLLSHIAPHLRRSVDT